jgi:hypothetical protein
MQTKTQSTAFRFNENKAFADNCRTFLEKLRSDDAEMAAILLDNWDLLATVVREGQRDLKARGEFNSKIASTLDMLLKPNEPKGGA